MPVSNLIVDLMLLSAALPGVFPRVVFDSVSIYVTRGEGEIARDFDPAALVHNRGQRVPRFTASTAAPRKVFESPSYVIPADQG